MSEETFRIRSPIDGSTYAERPYLTYDQALGRTKAARDAQAEFKHTTVAERADLCRRFVDSVKSHLDEDADAVTRMMGKPIAHARGEIGGLEERSLAMAAMAEQTLAPEPVAAKPGFERVVAREPLGVVLDIAAWNYPWLVAVNVVVPAVLAGNAVLLKHAVQTADVGGFFARSFSEAGAPEGLVQDFMADHEVIGRILDRGLVDHVGFTGSVQGGHEVYARVAKKNLISCGLELGGKDPALVLEDADLDYCVPQIVDGCFFNAGQSCCAVERIYVARSRFEDFVERFVGETKKLRLGSPLAETTTLGPVVNARAAARIEEQAADAIASGARRVLGNDDFEVPELSNCYLAPQVFIGVSHDMLLMREESFGPVVGIMAYDDDQEAVALANDTSFGLTASIWSPDLERVKRLAPLLRAGTVFANRADYVDPELPWSGMGDSGFGVTLSAHGLLALTRTKSLHFKQQPGN